MTKSGLFAKKLYVVEKYFWGFYFIFLRGREKERERGGGGGKDRVIRAETVGIKEREFIFCTHIDKRSSMDF